MILQLDRLSIIAIISRKCDNWLVMTTQERFIHELKRQGHSVTKSRQAVFAALQRWGPIDVRRLIQSVHTTVDRATVYRVVSLFEELGIVRRIPYGWKYKLELSDTFTDHHHHAHCIRCEKLITLHEHKQLEQAIEQTARDHGITPTEHHLEIYGYCSDCRDA